MSTLSLFQSPSFGARHALAEIETSYGDVVRYKGKSLNKFGSNQDVGTSRETVAQFQGATANEAFVTTNIIDSISSSSASDTTQTVVIEGHTIDEVGNLTFVSQEAIIAGQTKVTLTTPMARANRMYVKSSGTFGTTPAALVGTVYCYDDTDGISAGVPVTAAATKVLIIAGKTQSEKAATSISSKDYWIITRFSAVAADASGPTGFATVQMETRDIVNGGAWRPLGREFIVFPAAVGPTREFTPLIIVPKNHDWRVVAFCNAGSSIVEADAEGYLATI